MRTADFAVDLAAHRVWRDGEEVHLTPTEWELVEHLVRNPGTPAHPAPAAAAGVGTRSTASETNYLRVYLAQLRRKLEPDPSRPRYFITEPGMGYRFEPDEPGPPASEAPSG